MFSILNQTTAVTLYIRFCVRPARTRYKVVSYHCFVVNKIFVSFHSDGKLTFTTKVKYDFFELEQKIHNQDQCDMYSDYLLTLHIWHGKWSPLPHQILRLHSKTLSFSSRWQSAPQTKHPCSSLERPQTHWSKKKFKKLQLLSDRGKKKEKQDICSGIDMMQIKWQYLLKFDNFEILEPSVTKQYIF